MRRDITFTSNGTKCVGWLYLPDRRSAGQRVPAIIMANAITAVKEMVLPGYAERFAAAGFGCLAFDFRFLGESGGEPRGQIFAAEQIEDLRNAISWLLALPEVDPNRIGAWGASFGGAHVLNLAAFDKRIKAAVAVAPSMRAADTMIHFMGRQGLAKVQEFLAYDRTTRHQSGQVTFMKAVSDGSENAMLPNPEANEFYTRLSQTIAPNWRNQVTVESLEKLIEYDPAASADLISPTPLLMIIGEQDRSQPANLAPDAFARIDKPKKLVAIAAGHTDLLAKDEYVTQAANASIEWFGQYLGGPPATIEHVGAPGSLQEVEANKALVRRYFDTIWNKGDLHREAEFVGQNVVTHAPPIPGVPEGISGPLTIVSTFRSAVPDLHLTQDVVYGGGDKVVQIYTTRGFHTGTPLFGFPPQGAELVLTGVNIFRVANGRIAERWGVIDVMGLMQQLGVAPATPEELLDLRKGWNM